MKCALQETKWYVWPKDSETNEFLAGGIGKYKFEQVREDVRCADGVPRNLYICSRGYQDVRDVIGGMQKFNLKFEIFKEEIEDTIVRYDLWKISAAKEAKHAKSAQAILLDRERRHS